jgi:acyl-CoA synthetase
MSAMLSLLDAAALREFYRRGLWRDETIYDIAHARATAHPDRFAIRDRHRRLTYPELVGHADALAADLHTRGVRVGQRVAFWMPDRVEIAIAVLACSRNGYVCCPSLHRNHTVGDGVRLLERMRAVALIRQRGFGADGTSADVTGALAALDALGHVYVLMPNGPDDRPAEPFSGQYLHDAAEPPEPAGDPDRVSYLAFTSGSTGAPKGVMHSDNTQLVTARGISRDWDLGTDTVIYSMSPLSHNLGMGSFLTSLVAGGEFAIHDRERGESLIERIEKVGATYLVGVPTHAIDLLTEQRETGRDRIGKVTGFRISGAAAPRTVFETLLSIGICPQSGYGMTENNAHQYTRPDDDPALIISSCGRAVEGYEIRIFDPEDPDCELPQGEIGLVAGKGACLMLGYFDDQKACENAFNSEGWFLTGDLGRLDEAGNLTLTGRRKEVIVRGGHNINPERIEELATRHPRIEHAAALPMPDDRLGEKVCLTVMFSAHKTMAFDDILAHLAKAGLSRYDMPEYILAVDDIPLMANGKIARRSLAQSLVAGLLVPEPVHYRVPKKPKD